MDSEEGSGGGGFLKVLLAFLMVFLVAVFVPLFVASAYGNDIGKAISFILQNGYTVFANGDLPTGALVGTTDTQTLSNKTFTGTTVFSTSNISTLNAPTGRGATYVIAASDAPANVKTQADLLTSTDAGIMSAVNALAANSTIALSGTFQMTTGNTTLNLTKAMHFTSLGFATLNFTNTTWYVYGNSTTLLSDVSFDHIAFIGSPSPSYPAGSAYNNAFIQAYWVKNFRYEYNYACMTDATNNGTPIVVGSIGGQGAPTENQDIYVRYNKIDSAGYGILFNTVKNGWIEHNNIENTWVNAIGAAYWGSSFIHVNHNTIKNSGHGAIAFSNGQNCEAIGNIISGISTVTEGGIEVQSKHAGWPYAGIGSSNITIVGNVVTGSLGWGIYVNGNNGVGDGGALFPSYGVVITGNTLASNNIGIFLDQYSVNTSIQGNSYYGNVKNISDNGTGTRWDDFDVFLPWLAAPSTVLYAPLQASWIGNSSANFTSADIYGHNVTFNTTWASNMGMSLNSTGNNTYINFGNSTNLDTTVNLTVIAWIKSYTPGAGNQHILSKGGTGFTGNGSWSFQLSSNTHFRPILTVNGTVVAIGNAGVMPANKWVMAAITYDGLTGSAYLNGILGASVNFTNAGSAALNTPIYAGYDGTNFVNGMIGTVVIANQAWTPYQISAFYQATAWRYINN